jgi:hypothetical protein
VVVAGTVIAATVRTAVGNPDAPMDVAPAIGRILPILFPDPIRPVAGAGA